MAVVKIDQKTCIGCGFCVSMCPEVFELRDDKHPKELVAKAGIQY